MFSGASGWHVPDLIRGLCVLAIVPGLGWFMLTPTHGSALGPLGWVLGALFAAFFGTVGARILRHDARAPKGRLFVFRTRLLNEVVELAIAGMGASLLWMAAVTFVDLGMEGPGTKTPIAGVLLAAVGLPMVFWRPQFVLDAEERTLRRFPFGRSLPIRHQQMHFSVRVGSDDYYVGARVRQKVGDMIRGRTAAGDFELELVPLGTPPGTLDARVRYWRQTLDAL
jgi:predicted outer membrane lipoprotein